MRFVSVLGAIGVGLAIGSAVVLAPLAMGTAGPGPDSNTTSGSAQWASQWGRQAISSVRSLTGASAKSENNSAASVASGRSPGHDANLPQASKTIDYLAQSGALTAKLADAPIVQTPWATQVTVSPESAAPK